MRLRYYKMFALICASFGYPHPLATSLKIFLKYIIRAYYTSCLYWRFSKRKCQWCKHYIKVKSSEIETVLNGAALLVGNEFWYYPELVLTLRCSPLTKSVKQPFSNLEKNLWLFTWKCFKLFICYKLCTAKWVH